MWADQAIFTSLLRDGVTGYRLVSRSPGIDEADSVALATWSPSHGSLIVDPWNKISVNYFPLPSGRLAIARTCEGSAEASGRGGRQVYTHLLVVEAEAMAAVGYQPMAFYRDALALGYSRHRADPDPELDRVRLSVVHPRRGPSEWAVRAEALGIKGLEGLRSRLLDGENLALPHAGDRVAVAEAVLGTLPRGAVLGFSFSTSLRPSAARPYRLALVGVEG